VPQAKPLTGVNLSDGQGSSRLGMTPNFKAQWIQKVVLVLCLGLSYVSFILVHNIVERRSQETFKVFVDQGTASLNRRGEDLSRTLDGVAGLILASNSVSANEMAQYAQALNIGDKMPVIDAIGFAIFDEVAARNGINSDGSTDGQRPAINAAQGHLTSNHVSVRLIEPGLTNERFLKPDFGSTPQFVATAKAAFASGQTHSSGVLPRAVSSAAHPQAFLLKPVFKTPQDAAETDPRQGAFLGFAFVVVNVAQVFEKLTISQGKLVDLNIFFDKEENEVLATGQKAAPALPPAQFSIEQSANRFGKSLSLRWDSRPEFEAVQPFRAKWFVLGLGIWITALIYLISGILIRRDRTVSELVDRKSREIETQTMEKRAILGNAMLAIVSVTQTGRIIHANDASTKLLSARAPDIDLDGSNIMELLPDFDIKAADGWTKLNVSSAGADAAPLILEVEKKTWETADGEMRITLLLRDITVSERLAQEVIETEQRLNLALIGAEVGVFDVNIPQGTSVVSETWSKSLQIAVGPECKNPYVEQLGRMHPDDLEILQNAEAACIAGLTDRAEARFRVQIDSGEWRWIKSDAVIAERAEDGTALRMLGIQTDITESIKLEQMKRDFVATVSHELRTPLTSVNGALALLQAKRQGLEPDGSERLIEIGIKNCDRLLGLVNDILDMEKINTGMMSHDVQPEDVADILRLATEQLETYSSQWNVDVEVRAPEFAQCILTDKKRVMQVLTNLLSNACKFAYSGTTVCLGAEHMPDCTRISVRNVGPSIPEEFRDKIFQPFSQADNSNTRERGGTGLGLNISRHLVEAMGGTIGFESGKDDETVFWFTCPRAEDAPETEQRPLAHAHRQAA
jgi:signal transduction histidine kinase/CHASE1-domain containing sensor protein